MHNMNLIKKSEINLTKGSTISLEKKGRAMSQVMVGINWGAIERKLWGLPMGSSPVDLDSSVALASKQRVIDNVYYKKLRSSDGAVRHSGDDRVGDRDGDDGNDNETIHLDLRTLNPDIDQVVFYLNSFEQQDFASIPYAKIRIIDATDPNALEELATFNVATDKTFKGFVSMVLGKFVRTNSGWDFKSLGEPISARNITECVRAISQSYIK
jgi:tellurium resistance protein TerZ